MGEQITRRLLSWELWVYGLVSGFIGGGATAVVSAGGLAAAHGSGIDVPVLNLKAMGIIFLSSGITTALSYLAKSPLPPINQPTNTETK